MTRRRNAKGQFKSSRSNPMDEAGEFIDTGKNLFMQYGLAALASTGTVKGADYLLKKVPNISSGIKEWAMIAGPAIGGIIISMSTSKRSAIAQGIAGGMVLASANGLSDKLLDGGSAQAQMADANHLQKGDMIIKQDGTVVDQHGNAVAKIDAGGQQQQQPQPQALPDMASTGYETHLLGEANSWETGEAWEA